MAGHDMSDYWSLTPVEREAIVQDIREKEGDLRIQVAEHLMGYLDGQPDAGNNDTFPYRYTARDLDWDSETFWFLHDDRSKQKHPRLAEAVHLVTIIKQEVMMKAGEGQPLRDPDTLYDIVNKVVGRIGTLDHDALGGGFSHHDWLEADKAFIYGTEIPRTPVVQSLEFAANLIIDSYYDGHGGLQSTPLY